jgi:S-adenosylmethionine synthetase
MGGLDWLRPDGKSQVTVEYEDGVPKRVTAVVISTQHHPDVGRQELEEGIRRDVIEPVVPSHMCDHGDLKYYINPTGRFVIGGPQGDAGVTGRKVIVDTYGGVGSHGGGAFSGKDPTKVDRSASYAARWVAKNIVAAGLAKRAEIQLAYAIGVAEPVSIMLNSYGTGVVPDDELERCVAQVFDLRPLEIIRELKLRKPIFRRTAAYGHFGREPTDDGAFGWERIDRVDDLKSCL